MTRENREEVEKEVKGGERRRKRRDEASRAEGQRMDRMLRLSPAVVHQLRFENDMEKGKRQTK